MKTKECKKCVYYGGKRNGNVICLNDKCVKSHTEKGASNGGKN